MKALCLLAIAAVTCICLSAQTPKDRAVTRTLNSDLGFSYALPSDWQVMDAPASLPDVKQQARQNAATEDEKKGVACIQLLLTARHGSPASVVVEVALPFACFGQEMTEKDLPGFAAGASEGLKQTLDLGDPVYSEYSLGSHRLWIERAKGTPKGQSEISYTVEIACSLVKQAAVCWMTMAADDPALRTFEGGAVTLDGEKPVPLVPANAFDKKPS